MKLLISSLIVLSHSAFAGISNTMAWNREAITVCFGQKGDRVQVKGIKNKFSNWKESDKAEIMHVLQEEFTPERTGYHFVGFEDCTKTKNSAVVILKTSYTSFQTFDKKGAATVGMQIYYPMIDAPSVKGVVALSPLGIQHATITHEFGHILGLKHEHEHPDAYLKSEDSCGYYSKEPIPRKNYYIYTDFDEDSVMNYCKVVGPLRSKKGLSDGDVNHIRELYLNSVIGNKRTF